MHNGQNTLRKTLTQGRNKLAHEGSTQAPDPSRKEAPTLLTTSVRRKASKEKIRTQKVQMQSTRSQPTTYATHYPLPPSVRPPAQPALIPTIAILPLPLASAYSPPQASPSSPKPHTPSSQHVWLTSSQSRTRPVRRHPITPPQRSHGATRGRPRRSATPTDLPVRHARHLVRPCVRRAPANPVPCARCALLGGWVSLRERLSWWRVGGANFRVGTGDTWSVMRWSEKGACAVAWRRVTGGARVSVALMGWFALSCVVHGAGWARLDGHYIYLGIHGRHEPGLEYVCICALV
jgi:hypothetical protein